jgi:aspartyl-tRNA(Asn)/glutamyl-tRNA(Gln) amidotransferase subunit A
MNQVPSRLAERAALVRRGELRAVDLVGASLDRIDELNPILAAFSHVAREPALAEAARVDRLVRDGQDPGPLAGIPFGVKDLDRCRGMPTRYGSWAYRDAPADSHDDPIVERLRAAGAVPLGKTSTPEFGGGILTATRRDGPTRNPWDLDRTPGGSSGGSAAAVAAGLIDFATASDGGGSIRIPSSFCGTVGLKTSNGLVPVPDPGTARVICAGVITPGVLDTAYLLDVVTRADPRRRPRDGYDPTWTYYSAAQQRTEPEASFAWWWGWPGLMARDDVRLVCESAADLLVRSVGGAVVDVTTELPTDPNLVLDVIGAVDRVGNLLARSGEIDPDDISPYYRKRIDKARKTTVDELAAGHRRRLEIEAATDAVLDVADFVLAPTTTTTAFPAEGPPPTTVGDYRGHEMAAAPFTRVANLCGLPAISVPVGFGADRLPVGLQLMTRTGFDSRLLALANELEGLLDLDLKPPLVGG